MSDYESHENPPSADTTENTYQSEPTEKLPAKKVSTLKQFEVLRSYGIVSTQQRHPVSLKDLAEVAGMHQNSASMCNPFFIDIGLVEKNGHKFTPSKEVVDYSARMSWDEGDAALKLQPPIAASWFGSALVPRLQMRALEEEKAVGVLADICGASPEYKTQLVMLIDYLEITGLVRREAGMINLVQPEKSLKKESDDKMKVEPPPKNSNDEIVLPKNADTFQIPIPGKDSATITVPKGLETEDWAMLKTMIDAYIKRLQKDSEVDDLLD